MAVTIFCTPLNNASATIADAYTPGDTELTVEDATVFGSPTSSAPVRFTAITADSFQTAAEVLTIFKATGKTGNTLTGLTVIEGSTDRTFAVGDKVEVRATAGSFSDLHSAVNTLQVDVGTLTTSVSGKADDAAVVHLSGTETIAGTKTFSSTIVGDINGNAATVTTISGRVSAGSGVTRTGSGTAADPYVIAITTDATNASNISSGTLAAARGGTGLDASAANNGQLLIGNGSGLSLATLTAGSGISVTNGAGSVTIAATGSGTGTVTSVTFTGDGTVLSSTPSSAVTTSGTVSATLATAAPYTCLANGTGSAAAPTYSPYFGGSQTLTGATTLTTDSPSYTICDMTGGAYAVTLPASSAAAGKEFVFERRGSSNTLTLTAAGSDVIANDVNTASTLGMSGSSTSRRYTVRLFTDGSGTWFSTWSPCGAAFPLTVPYGGTGTAFVPAGSVVCGNGNSPLTSSGTGTSGQLLQSNGSSASSWTSNPTITHIIGGGTAPTIAATGTGAGTGPTLSIVAGGHDLGGQISILTGSAPGTSTTVATVSFGGGAYPSAPAAVILTPANAAAAALTGGAAIYVSSTTTGGFVLSIGSSGLAATTQYLWNFAVIG